MMPLPNSTASACLIRWQHCTVVHDPAPREDDEAFGRVRPLDDFERPIALSFQGVLEFVARIAGVGENVAQPGGTEGVRQDQSFGSKIFRGGQKAC